MNLNSGTVGYALWLYWCVAVLFEDMNVTSFIHSVDMNQSYFPTRLLNQSDWNCNEVYALISYQFWYIWLNLGICKSPIEFHRKEADEYFWRFEIKIVLSVDKNGTIGIFILLIWILMNIWLVWF